MFQRPIVFVGSMGIEKEFTSESVRCGFVHGLGRLPHQLSRQFGGLMSFPP